MLIISQRPVPLVKEALKYRSVEDVVVIGSDPPAIGLIEKYIPTNDCTFLLEESPSCIESASAKVLDEDVQVWLKHKSPSDFFHIILVDVSIIEHSRLSVVMYNKLYHHIEPEDSITSAVAASAPSVLAKRFFASEHEARIMVFLMLRLSSTMRLQLPEFFCFVYGFESKVLGIGGWAVTLTCKNTSMNNGC